jgi:hypothetical protein
VPDASNIISYDPMGDDAAPDLPPNEYDVLDVAALSMKELKALIKSAGLTRAGCNEKHEVRERAEEARVLLAEERYVSFLPSFFPSLICFLP